jgi:meso-butanediol dehydrogenase/(S,S)-butanediol dehydrogenase/diacetyl reductase
MNRFEGKTALVTGAGSGIGRAVTLRLAEEGASVYLADISEAGMAETAAQLPANCTYQQFLLDVGDASACREVIAQVAAIAGQLDVLCNIAGIALCQNFTDISDDDWRRVIDINLNGVFYLCQAAMPHLLESGGNIVNMSSSAGRTGQAYNSAYCATKAAVLMLSKALAVEYAGRGVRVNAVCPGAVSTPLVHGFTPPEDADPALFARMLPLLPMAEAEEIAAAVAYLASAEARFVTGIDFAIDGGQTAG